ncbi:MAG: FkbM family methyltransferase, partial [bacterium]|nr:FkbM family methyltransferase [bacterium]
TMRAAARFCRALPLRSGIGTMSQSISRRIKGLRSGTELACTLRNGVRINARLDDYNGRMLYLFGTPDPKVISICGGLLRPGDVFLDIGANYGSVGLLVNASVLPGGRVHMVEPQPELGDRIEEAISANTLGHMTLHRCGLWDEDGEFYITGSRSHTGTASISTEARSDGSQRVEVRNIEGFLRETTGGSPFGVKLDVEGAEVRILPAILSHPDLRFVIFESHDQDVKAFVKRMMEERSQVFFGVSRSLFRTRLVRIHDDSDLNDAHDVLAIRTHDESTPPRALGVRELRRLLR